MAAQAAGQGVDDRLADRLGDLGSVRRPPTGQRRRAVEAGRRGQPRIDHGQGVGEGEEGGQPCRE